MKPHLVFICGRWLTFTNHFKRQWQDLTFIEQQHISKAYAWCDGKNSELMK